jgi:hypothetical protein
MNRHSVNRIPLAAVAALSLLGGASLAQAASGLPPVQTKSGVQYLSGGIGKHEAQAIQHASRDWPLMMEFAEHHKPRDEFVADVHAVVRNATGQSVLALDSHGPLVLARVAPGSYTVDATLDGRKLHEKVTIQEGHTAKAVFVWPAGTDKSRA